MSQFYVQDNTVGPFPPSVPTQFTTDDGTAVPAGNNLNVLGGSGIETFANPNLSDNLFISIQNSCTSTGQTVGATTTDLCTTDVSTAGTYTFEYRIAAWTSTGAAGAGYSMNSVVSSDGITPVLVGTANGFQHEDSSLMDADITLVISGTNAIVRVTGVAGLTINWAAFTVYIFRGA